ncbi:MAG: sugar transferase, partial [Chthoniobacterales bacterium]|nr:sugar transferase [Chthoniobacterales bacterium]
MPRWKRRLDLALVILSAPLWAPIMGMTGLLIKLISPGPIFFRQERVGLGGVPFMILKFRSMKVNAETRTHEEYVESLMQNGAAMQKLDDRDSRLIPLGRLMRASGLDELPQIFNVISGHMSLVGPRPCTVLEFRHYQPWQKGRVHATPGLTGYWQVHGKNRTTF